MRYILIFLLLSVRVYGVNLLSLAQQMTLNTQTGWSEFPEANTPPGFSYRSQSPTSTTVRTGIVVMPTGVPAGVWRVLMKVIAFSPASGTLTNRVTISMPSGDIVRTPDDRDGDKYWTDYGLVTLSTALTNFGIKMDTTLGGPIGNCGIMAACFTTAISGVVTSDDYIQTWNLSATEDTSAPYAGNYVKNSSFEAGLTEVSLSSNTEKWFDVTDMWSNEEAHSGTHSLKVNVRNCAGVDSRWSAKVRTRSYLVRPDKKHSARVWVKIPDGGGGNVQLKIIPVETLPTGLGLPAMPVYQTASIPVTGTGWNEIKLEGQILRAYPTPAQYGVEIGLTGTAPATTKNVYFDDFQFSEGATISAYTPARPVEVQIANTKLGGQYYVEDNNCILQFRWSNNTTDTGVQGATYEIWDNKMESVKTGTVVSSTPSAGNDVVTGLLNLSSAGLGFGPFRIRARTLDSVTEMYFSILHAPRVIDPDLSHFGGHLDSYWYQAEIAAATPWTRMLSPNAVLRWSIVEPTNGTYVFSDAIVNRTLSVKKVFGVLDSSRPAWAKRVYFEISTPTGAFVPGETVTQTTPSAASGTITYVFVAGTHQNGPALQLNATTGTFVKGSTITGGTSGATATLTTVQIIDTPDYPGYTNYVQQIVNHWKHAIKIWELDNEPHLDSGIPSFQADGSAGGSSGTTAVNYKFYGQMCKGVMQLMPSLCPDCKIVAIGGSPDDTTLQRVWNSIDSTTRSQFWGASLHFYNANGSAAGAFNPSVPRAQSAAEFLAAQSPPITNVWNTESGSETFSQFYGNLANWRNHGEALMPYRDAEDQIKSWTRAPYKTAINIAGALGGKFNRYFMYDSRWARWYSDAANSFSGFQYSDVDLNDTVNPLGATLRTQAWFLDSPNLTTIGNVPTPMLSHTRAYGFSGAGDGTWDLLMVHAYTNYHLLKFTWSLTPSQYDVYDLFGNVIPQSSQTITYSGGVITIKAKPPLTLGTMAAAFGSATFAAATDTTLPNLVIVGYPPADCLGSLESHRVRLRWIAWDDIDYQVADNVLGMSFRWKLVPNVTFSSFSPWSQFSFVEIPAAQMTSGTQTLTVEAMDRAGNVDTKSVTFDYAVP